MGDTRIIDAHRSAVLAIHLRPLNAWLCVRASLVLTLASYTRAGVRRASGFVLTRNSEVGMWVPVHLNNED